MSDLSATAENTVERIIGVIVVLAIIGATAALMFTNLGVVLDVFTSVDTGNTVLDAVIPVLAIPLGLTVVFGLYKLVRGAFSS